MPYRQSKKRKKCKAHNKDLCDVFLFFLVYLFIRRSRRKGKKVISLSGEPPIEDPLCLFILRVHILNERNTEFLSKILELVKVLLVLLLVFNFGFDACSIVNAELQLEFNGWGRPTLEDSHGGREIIDPSSGLERSDDDGGGWDKVIGEGVV